MELTEDMKSKMREQANVHPGKSAALIFTENSERGWDYCLYGTTSAAYGIREQMVSYPVPGFPEPLWTMNDVIVIRLIDYWED